MKSAATPRLKILFVSVVGWALTLVIVGIPAYRPSCGVYLFNSIKVGGADDPLGTWAITVTSGGRTLRKLSVRQMKKLTTDLDGYRLLKLSD